MSGSSYIQCLTSDNKEFKNVAKDFPENINKLIQQIKSKPYSELEHIEGIECVSSYKDIKNKKGKRKKSKKEDMDVTIKINMANIEEIIRKNRQISTQSKSLVRRKIISMEYLDAKILTLLPEETTEIYSIKSYTYNSVISIPVRGSFCSHYDVVDLEYLLRYHYSKKWGCPLCGKEMKLSTICIDKVLEKELKKIRDLPESQQPDYLVRNRNDDRFIKANFGSFKDDIINAGIDFGLPENYKKYVQEAKTITMLDFSNLWITPNTQYLEMLFELIKPEAEPIGRDEICFVPIIIFGDYESVNDTKFELLDIKGEKNIYFVTFAPLLYDYGYKTQAMIIKFIRELNKKLRVVILMNENYLNELCDYEDILAISQDDTDLLLYPENVKVPGYFKNSEVTTSIKKILQDKIAKLELTDRFNEKVYKSFPKEFSSEDKQKEIIEGDIGIIFKFPFDISNPSSYSNYITVVPKKINQFYTIRLGIASVKNLTENKVIKYFPDYTFTSKFQNESCNEVIIFGPKVTKELTLESVSKTVLLPMALSNYVGVFYDGQNEFTINALLFTKKLFPSLLPKPIFVFVQTSEKNIDMKEEVYRLLQDYDNNFESYDDGNKWFNWKYNIEFTHYKDDNKIGTAENLSC